MKILRPRRTTLALALGAVLISGCSMIPKYERPAAPVAPAWPAPSATQGKAASELPWQEFFADAKLRRLIELALACWALTCCSALLNAAPKSGVPPTPPSARSRTSRSSRPGVG